MAGREFKVVVEWDYDAAVWVATSTDVAGLVVQGETPDDIVRKVRLVIPALTETGVEADDTIHFTFRRKERAKDEERFVPIAA